MSSPRLESALRARPRQRMELAGFTESAVLLPLFVDDEASPLDEARLLFTVRHDQMRTHAGQISFPGGRRDATDADLTVTALREAEEELGISPARVRVIGFLDDVPTPSSYVITPVVGLIQGAVELVPQATEVAATFEHTLAELRAPAVYHDAGIRTWQGVDYVLHEYRLGAHRIWGATARMVHQLLELL